MKNPLLQQSETPTVDLSSKPFLKTTWRLKKHNIAEPWTWNPHEVHLLVSPLQSKGKWVEGNRLHTDLLTKRCFNANLLEYLLAHKEIIPEDWKGFYVFFWGTLYQFPSNHVYVRCLYWERDHWDWSFRWLDDDFGETYVAAVRM